MSNDQSPKSSVTVVPETSGEEKRPNVLVRAARKIKSTPPRTALAVGLGVGLVGAGMFVGRKTAPLHLEIVEDDFDTEPLLVTPSTDESA